MRLKNKVSVITGSGKGIGKATALLFSKEGAKVALADVDKAGEDVVNQIERIGGTSIFVETDISVSEDCYHLMEETIREFGRIDILVNNAGIFQKGDIVSTSEENWKSVFAVNVHGCFNCSRYAAVHMIKQKFGNIVNVASAGGIAAIRNQMGYSASKAAMIMMSKSMAVDLACYNIRVNSVCPGSVETPLLKGIINTTPDPIKTRKSIERLRPASRIAQPEEIASAILFLASDESSYATGSSLVIDGGMTAW